MTLWHGKEGVDGSSPSEGFAKSLPLGPLFAIGTTVGRLGVHRASTTRRDCFLRCPEALALSGFAPLRCDVHPASTARSSAASLARTPRHGSRSQPSSWRQRFPRPSSNGSRAGTSSAPPTPSCSPSWKRYSLAVRCPTWGERAAAAIARSFSISSAVLLGFGRNCDGARGVARVYAQPRRGLPMIRHRLPLPAVAFAISMALTAAACAGSSSSTSATATGSIDVARLKGRIAFSAGPPHAEDVYIVAANGSRLVQLTHDGVSEFDPSWSPDGDRIAYRRQPGDDDTTEIYVAAADGKAAHDVSGNDDTADWGPAWSPRGDWIAWNAARKARFGGFDLGLVRPDGSRLHLVKPGIHVEYPAWSPDGRRIAFMSQVAAEGLQYDIFVIDADGSHIRRLTTSPATDGFPSWSPDGTTIAFSSTRTARTNGGSRSGSCTRSTGRRTAATWSSAAGVVSPSSARTAPQARTSHSRSALQTSPTGVAGAQPKPRFRPRANISERPHPHEPPRRRNRNHTRRTGPA